MKKNNAEDLEVKHTITEGKFGDGFTTRLDTAEESISHLKRGLGKFPERSPEKQKDKKVREKIETE